MRERERNKGRKEGGREEEKKKGRKKGRTVTSTGEDVEKLELLCIAAKSVKQQSNFGKCLSVSQIVKHKVTR